MAEHHHEKGEPPASVSHLDHARAAPVHLRGFSGREGQAQERGMAHRTHGTHVVLHDAHSSRITLRSQALEDLHGAVGVPIQPPGDRGFEGVEFARPLCALRCAPLLECRRPRVFRHRFRIEPQLAPDLLEGELPLLVVGADFAVDLVADHFASIMERRISPTESSSPRRGSGARATAAPAGSRLST